MPSASNGNRRISFLPYSPVHPSWLTSAKRDHSPVSRRSLPLSCGASPLRKTRSRSKSTVMAWPSVFWIKRRRLNPERKASSPILIEVPVRFRRRGVEAKLVVLDQQQRASEPDANLVKALARAHEWFGRIAPWRGKAESATSLAPSGFDRSYVTRVALFGLSCARNNEGDPRGAATDRN